MPCHWGILLCIDMHIEHSNVSCDLRLCPSFVHAGGVCAKKCFVASCTGETPNAVRPPAQGVQVCTKFSNRQYTCTRVGSSNVLAIYDANPLSGCRTNPAQVCGTGAGCEAFCTFRTEGACFTVATAENCGDLPSSDL